MRMLINLLPVREAQELAKGRQEIAFVVLLNMIMGTLVFVFFLYQQTKADALQKKVDILVQDINEMEVLFSKAMENKNKVDHIQSRLDTVLSLDKEKEDIVFMMYDIAQLCTRLQKVWLISFHNQNNKISLEGGAISHEDVSSLQMGLEREVRSIKNIRLSSVDTEKQNDKNYLRWSIAFDANFGTPG